MPSLAVPLRSFMGSLSGAFCTLSPIILSPRCFSGCSGLQVVPPLCFARGSFTSPAMCCLSFQRWWALRFRARRGGRSFQARHGVRASFNPGLSFDSRFDCRGALLPGLFRGPGGGFRGLWLFDGPPPWGRSVLLRHLSWLPYSSSSLAASYWSRLPELKPAELRFAPAMLMALRLDLHSW